jgi:hypothetical protein
MSTDNVTPIKPPCKLQKPSARDIADIVIRAKQIVRAVRVAEDHEATGDYPYALEQVEDMLEEAGEALSILEDAENREGKS